MGDETDEIHTMDYTFDLTTLWNKIKEGNINLYTCILNVPEESAYVSVIVEGKICIYIYVCIVLKKKKVPVKKILWMTFDQIKEQCHNQTGIN